MNSLLVADADAVIEQILVQCWMFEARGGDHAGARGRAERTLERLLSGGLPFRQDGARLRLDPYAAGNLLKARATEPHDEAWAHWLSTTRRNAVSLPAGPHRYRFTMRREWHAYASADGRPLVLRLPMPRRATQVGTAQVQLLEPSAGLLDVRESPGRVELRIDPATAHGPIVAQLALEFVGGDNADTLAPAEALAAPVEAGDQEWMRRSEGYVMPSAAVAALAAELAQGCRTMRDFAHRAWHWLISQLRFGDVHREHLDSHDMLGSLLQQRLADCVLGSSLLIALCRERGIPARLVSGYLLHPANPGPHSWAEVRLAHNLWVPFDFGSWCYSAGDPDDAQWGNFYRGRVDARFLAEIAPRDFTGWGSAPPPPRWYRLERLRGEAMEHSLHRLPDGEVFRRDLLTVDCLGPALAAAAMEPGLAGGPRRD